MSPVAPPSSRHVHRRPSLLLSSSAVRAGVALIGVAVIWLAAGWALEWW